MSANFNIIGTSAAGETFDIAAMNASLAGAEAFLDQFGESAVQVAAAWLYGEAENIMGGAKEDCPVDEGNLRDTGHVEKPVISGLNISIEMGFGGTGTPYALRQHEDLTYQHEVGKAKYLEDRFNAAIPGMDERGVAYMARELGQ